MSKITTFTTSGRQALRALAVAMAALTLAAGAQAQGHPGFHGGGHYAHGGGWGHGGYVRRGPGWGWGGLGLGLGIGLGLGSYYAYPWYAGAPDYVVVNPPVVYDAPQPVPQAAAPAQPIIYPRNGQSAAQTDADADACSQWAGRQKNATTDPSVFQRAVAACMDGRGYSLR